MLLASKIMKLCMRQGFLRGGNHLPDKHEGFERVPRGLEGTLDSSPLMNLAKLPPPQLIPPLEYSTVGPSSQAPLVLLQSTVALSVVPSNGGFLLASALFHTSPPPPSRMIFLK